MAEGPVHLLDVNVVVALLDQAHIYSGTVEAWFDTPGLQWALCAFSEAGVLRFFTRPKTGGMSMEQLSDMLESLKQQPGYRSCPIDADRQALTKPLRKRLHGHNQVTDAYLLGLAVREGLVVTTVDKALLYFAGEHGDTFLCWKRSKAGAGIAAEPVTGWAVTSMRQRLHRCAISQM